VWMYKTLDGRLSSGSKTVTVLMLTVPGRRTGIPRDTCVRYIDVGDGLLVWGTGSGSRNDPDWFQNLRRVDEADIQVRADHRRVKVHELNDAERDDAWKDVILAEAPEVAMYERRAGRTIPVAKLEPF
jgi:deazaflavin-dependent oxidoreductase (nitroreductase family)